MTQICLYLFPVLSQNHLALNVALRGADGMKWEGKLA